jgi:hypothetical protein
VAEAFGAAGPIAVAGGKDYRRSAAPLVGQPQQSRTANSETFTSPACGRMGGLRSILSMRSLRLQFCALQGMGYCRVLEVEGGVGGGELVPAATAAGTPMTAVAASPQRQRSTFFGSWRADGSRAGKTSSSSSVRPRCCAGTIAVGGLIGAGGRDAEQRRVGTLLCRSYRP